MWTGGVRVIVIDKENRILMVKQNHPERNLWTVPGGAIEDNEDSRQAAIREVREETGMEIEIKGLIRHVEETGSRGQRFVNFFMAEPAYSQGKAPEPKLGMDPELSPEEQVLEEVKFMSRDEVKALDEIYPEWIREEFWNMLQEGKLEYDAFCKRDRLL